MDGTKEKKKAPKSPSFWTSQYSRREERSGEPEEWFGATHQDARICPETGRTKIFVDLKASLTFTSSYISSYLTDRPDFRSVLNIQNSNMGATGEMWALHLRCVPPISYASLLACLPLNALDLHFSWLTVAGCLLMLLPRVTTAWSCQHLNTGIQWLR